MGANTYLTERERRILENAKVGIAGAGGLGSNVAMLLVRAGMKRLVIADFDTVNESNLNRQFFFRHQLGEKKIDALAANLHLIEPELMLELHDVHLSLDNVDRVFAGCQAIVEALDSAEGKAMLLHALLPIGKPVVSAIGLAGWGRSNDIRVRKVGRNLILVGDQTRDVRDGFVDAGIGLPSHAAEAIELGADAVLANTAVAAAGDPVKMAEAFKLAVRAAELALEAKPPRTSTTANATSPMDIFR